MKQVPRQQSAFRFINAGSICLHTVELLFCGSPLLNHLDPSAVRDLKHISTTKTIAPILQGRWGLIFFPLPSPAPRPRTARRALTLRTETPRLGFSQLKNCAMIY